VEVNCQLAPRSRLSASGRALWPSPQSGADPPTSTPHHYRSLHISRPQKLSYDFPRLARRYRFQCLSPYWPVSLTAHSGTTALGDLSCRPSRVLRVSKTRFSRLDSTLSNPQDLGNFPFAFIAAFVFYPPLVGRVHIIHALKCYTAAVRPTQLIADAMLPGPTRSNMLVLEALRLFWTSSLRLCLFTDDHHLR
jgi:hypothetical protein